MFRWFKEVAPIRVKLASSTAINGTITAAAVLTGAGMANGEMPLSAAGACTGVVGFSIAINLLMRKLIADPYVATVVRMEALAAGDIESDIRFTHFKDCVGRMTTAMNSFKVAAILRRSLEEQAVASMASQEEQRSRQSAIDSAKASDLRAFVHCVEVGFDALSTGDLTVRILSSVSPEFEPVRTKFNESISGLEEAIKSVDHAVGNIRVGLGEITVAASDLSQRTEQQAASLEQTVAALSEVTRGVNTTAGEAVQAQGTATGALKNAHNGRNIVGRAIEAMSQIEHSSDKISKIIGVIDEIAFQTNLLALNAGVEAARAGEAGRGFAVVAQEVRGLAQRSAEAAKEIKELISVSGTQVARGVELVTASGRSLEEIVFEVEDMAKVVSGIASAAQEQSLTLKEVSTAADHMDKVTQQNAAMVEQTTAAAQSLSSEIEDLAAMMMRFKSSEYAPSNASPTSKRSVSTSPKNVVQMRTVGRSGAKPGYLDDCQVNEWKDF